MADLPEVRAIVDVLSSHLSCAECSAGESSAPDSHQPLKLWVGLSGGVDSVLLLRLLSEARCALAPLSFELCAIHINHQLQPQAQSWAAWVSRWCMQQDVACVVVPVDIEAEHIRAVGVEAAARAARETIFQSLCTQNDGARSWLVLGHHADDQFETQLLRFLRGTGLQGLGGMSVFSHRGTLKVWRPLLRVTRARILKLAKHFSLEWVEDPSNLSECFDRNYLRHRIVPLLKKRWPELLRTTARCGDHLKESGAVAAEMADQLLRTSAGLESGSCAWPSHMDVGIFQQGSEAHAHLLLYRWLLHQGWQEVSKRQIQDIYQSVVMAGPDAQPHYIHRKARQHRSCLRRYQSRLYLSAEQHKDSPFGGIEPVAWNFATSPVLEWSHGRLQCLSVALCQAGLRRLSGEKQVSELVVVPRHSAVASALLPRRLKQRYQEARVPPWQRSGWPVILFKDRAICVPGVWYEAEFSQALDQAAMTVFESSTRPFLWIPA